MKLSYEGKIRKVAKWPATMAELRQAANKQFAERCLIEEFDTSQLKMSQLSSSKDQMLSFLNQSQAAAGQPQSTIDWYESNLCYEDSDGDLNTVSDDEDLADA